MVLQSTTEKAKRSDLVTVIRVQMKQEAQLLQRDRATLLVIEYFAKSLKVIRNDTVQQGVCKSLLVFHMSVYHTDSENNIVTLKFGLEVTEDHSNWYISKA